MQNLCITQLIADGPYPVLLLGAPNTVRVGGGSPHGTLALARGTCAQAVLVVGCPRSSFWGCTED